METYHVHIKGRVQGVGFRPFVYQLAQSYDLRGWVCNATDGVHIRFTGNENLAQQFYQDCLNKKPELAIITYSSIQQLGPEYFPDFRITESQNGDLELSISPDFAICSRCADELQDDNNRRYLYPFITCTQCGPRFSILKDLPYDRPFTTMDPFDMCPACESEYLNPKDRRYFSQTNSCATCGIKLSLISSHDSDFDHLKQSEILPLVISKLKEDCIVAVKGIGGFLLLCNANSEATIGVLRHRKNRPSKPFAVLYQDLHAVNQNFHLCSEERQLLTGPVSPIVLLSPTAENTLPKDSIAPGLEKIGVMLPYAPILKIIASQFGGPLIATSANVSGAPIVYGEDESGLLALADLVLSNNRAIHFPQDDSVMQFSPENKQQIILRRSRGLAPGTFTDLRKSKANTLALGAEMKGAFALALRRNTYISQYLGNLGHYENQVLFETVLDNFISLTHTDIEQIAIDSHPGYFTHQLGKTLAVEKGAELIEIQHHEAHFAAILAEKKLTNEDNVLGVIWDGTGFGTDGNSWGGEFFDYSDGLISRITHLSYFQNLSNDRMAIDNRLCALSLAGEEHWADLEEYFTQTEWGFYTKTLLQPGRETSSMGRVFDAVAFLAGISKFNAYEGESATRLEQAAGKFLSKNSGVKPYEFGWVGNQIQLNPLMREIFHDRKIGYEGIAARFHLTLIEMVRKVAEVGAYDKIAFSGGVFQNGLLVDLLIDQLGRDFELHFHSEFSPNDENIAYGQLAHWQCSENKENVSLKSVEPCV